MADHKLNPEALVGGCEPSHPGDISQKESEAGILPSHGNYDFPLHGLHGTWLELPALIAFI